jgi:hypothetical protein
MDARSCSKTANIISPTGGNNSWRNAMPCFPSRRRNGASEAIDFEDNIYNLNLDGTLTPVILGMNCYPRYRTYQLCREISSICAGQLARKTEWTDERILRGRGHIRQLAPCPANGKRVIATQHFFFPRRLPPCLRQAFMSKSLGKTFRKTPRKSAASRSLASFRRTVRVDVYTRAF